MTPILIMKHICLDYDRKRHLKETSPQSVLLSGCFMVVVSFSFTSGVVISYCFSFKVHLMGISAQDENTSCCISNQRL